MNNDFCTYAAILYTAALAAAAVVAASGVAGERARGTWTSLLATPLDRAEIVRAKMFGAAWAVRVPLGMIAFLYLAALATTAMHPFGFVIGVAGVSAFLWPASALGTYVSLRSRDATQAIGRTLMILLAINLVPGVVLAPFLEMVPALVFFGCTPLWLTMMPLSWFRFVDLQIYWGQGGRLLLASALGLPLAHALAAWFLSRAAFRQVEGQPFTLTPNVGRSQPSRIRRG